MNKITLAIIVCIFTTACLKEQTKKLALPFIYHVDMHQGNRLEQSSVDRLAVGMSKEKVNFVMGTALLISPFNNNRWDYIQIIRKNKDEHYSQRRISLFFKDEKLDHIQGNIVVVDRSDSAADSGTASSITITQPRKKKSLLSKLFGLGEQPTDNVIERDIEAQTPTTSEP